MILRTPKNRDNPYAQISKFALGDPGLSWKAKGLLAYLLSLPDDWYVRPRELRKHSKTGVKATYSAINELISAGYLQRLQKRNQHNQFMETEYIIFEFPSLVNSVISSVPLSRIPKRETRAKSLGKMFKKQQWKRGETRNPNLCE